MTMPPLPTERGNWTAWGTAVHAAAAAVTDGRLTDASLKVTLGSVVSVLTYGAKGNGTDDDHDAIDAALAEVSAGGIVVFPAWPWQSGTMRNYRTSGGHVIPPGVTLEFHGTTVTHTGDNVCFNYNRSGAFNLDRPGGAVGLRLLGNAGANAVGVEFGNAWGLFLHQAELKDYTNGVAVQLHNAYNWVEGTSINGVKIATSKVGLRFKRTTGEFSFGYTQIDGLAINVPANGIGIDFGSTATSTTYLYNSDIRATMWLLGVNAAGLLIGAQATSDNVRLFIRGEIPGNAGDTTGAYGVKNLGGTLKAFGHVNIKGAANDLSLGLTRVVAAGVGLDSYSGTDGTSGDVFMARLMANPDNPQDATFGHIGGSGRSIPFASGFDGNDSFRVYKVPIGGKPSTGTNVFRVRNDGGLGFGSGVSGRIHAGSGVPAYSAGFGALAERTDDPVGFPLLYVKTTGSGTGGWLPIDHRRADTTANRPTLPNGQQRGYTYFDTTLGRPIWWNGSIWIDAMGTAV